MTAAEISAQLPKANLKVRWTHPIATTENIIQTIEQAHPIAVEQTKNLAKALRKKYGSNNLAICKEIHRLLKSEIKYVEDKANQVPRLPAAFWKAKQGDCKSYSLFTCAILCNLGIPNAYTYVAWDNVKGRYTHVFCTAVVNLQKIPIDGVWEGSFGTEKRPTQKLTKHNVMPVGIMTGIGNPNLKKASELKLDKGYYHGIVQNYGEEAMDMLLLKEQMELLKEIAQERSGINGIGATNKALNMLDQRIEEINRALDGEILKSNGKDFAAQLNSLTQSRMQGIGASIGKTNFFKKITNTVKKVTKGVASAVHKVIATPLRGVLDIAIPKAAGAFLYTFMSDAEAAKYSQAVQQKRRKQQKLFNTIADVSAMKKEHLQKIIRNGFLKKNRMQPEEYLKQLIGGGKTQTPAPSAAKPQPGNATKKLVQGKQTAKPVQGKKINGYGDSDEQMGFAIMAVTGLLAAIGPVIEAISKIFGKKVEAPTEADMPTASDFGGSDSSSGGGSSSGETQNKENSNSGNGNSSNGSGSESSDGKNNTVMYVGLGIAGLAIAYTLANSGGNNSK